MTHFSAQQEQVVQQDQMLPSEPPDDRFHRALLHDVHPRAWRNPKSAGKYNLVVIGAGPAGSPRRAKRPRSARRWRLSNAISRRRSLEFRMRPVEGDHSHRTALCRNARRGADVGARAAQYVGVDFAQR